MPMGFSPDLYGTYRKKDIHCQENNPTDSKAGSRHYIRMYYYVDTREPYNLT